MSLIKLSSISLFLFCVYLVPSQAAEQLYSAQPTVSPSLSSPGKWPVGVTTLNITNQNQLSSADFVSRVDRELVLEVWYPAAIDSSSSTASYEDQTRSGKSFELLGQAKRDIKATKSNETFPLVVLSHGYTGYRSIMFYLGEHLASHGYIVASIDHTDSRNRDIDFAANGGAGFMSTLLNRARDQQFVLDHLNSSKSIVSKNLDPDKAAVIGYSMGGYGAINTIGGCYNFTQESMQRFGVPESAAQTILPAFNICSAGNEVADPRWQAMIAFAPWGGEQAVHQADSLENLKVPTLFVAGEIDDVSGYEKGVKSLFEKVGSTENYMMVYENARHNIAAHPAPAVAYDNDFDMGHYYEPSWNSETINRVNNHMSLVFLDCQVKAKQDACAMLPVRQDITQTRKADGTLTKPWPGFPERWGAGIQFMRK